MSLNARRVAYVLVVLGLMFVTTSTLFVDVCTSLLGDDVGGAQAEFWNLQCETYFTVLMVVFVLELTWRLRRGADGWTVDPPSTGRRIATYAIFGAVALVFAAERPVREILEPLLPDDIAFSLAHYLRRGLEAPLTILPLLVFLDFVLPFRRRDRVAQEAVPAT